MNALATIAGARLVVVTGKGGVGKSAVSAAIAWALAESGQRVLLVEVDPRESLHELLGVAPSGGDRVAVRPRLWLESLRPRQVIDREIGSRIPIGFLARRVLASPIYHHFVEGAPGLEELAVLEQLRRALEGDVDVAVLDGAATGHALGQIRAPRLVADAVRSGPLAEIANRLALLVENRFATRVVLVTQPEEMPVEETFELATLLAAEGGLRPALLVVNQVLPRAGGEGTGTAWDFWRARRALQETQLARLTGEWQGAQVALDWLPLPRGADLVRALALSLRANEAGDGGES